MWRKASKNEEDEYLRGAIEFTGDAELYGRWMRIVIVDWPISCEHNLTDLSINRRAWVGHAATCLAIQCPEYITRMAWGHLSNDQRTAANAQADHAIGLWESGYERNPGGQICLRLF
jgi:hypothetical protein